ncbi:hypothetical protein F0562_007041 [Nyssa sinensis]|uniref:Bulb-type lectin domain-containing protein n=1 Tax=Nyssa sinensis TaxID=561372 RepID=A0A5J5A1Z6_9ASTE|nr:hypothetical protein F0562_007041 [Nyssa sinensis]
MVMATRAGGSLNRISFLIFAFLFNQGLDSSLVAGANTIGIGDELNSFSNPLVSPSGRFSLGFFNFSNRGFWVDTCFYLGIWYTSDIQARKVWVANPNTPLYNPGAVLTIDGAGILKITNGRYPGINISDQVGTGNVTATLHDSGAFTLRWEPTQESGQLVMYRRGEVYWKSGLFKNQSFEFMPAIFNSPRIYDYNLSYGVSNINDEFSFTIHAHGGNSTRWVLTPNGQIREGFTTSSGDYNYSISAKDFCYGYESDNGCAESVVPQPECRDRNSTFELMTGYFRGDYARTINKNWSLIPYDCMEICWNDCTCFGFTSEFDGLGCVFWVGKMDFLKDEIAGSTYVLVSQNSSQGIKWIIIVVGISLPVFLISLLCYQRMRKLKIQGEEKKRREKYLREFIASDSFKNANDVEEEGMQGASTIGIGGELNYSSNPLVSPGGNFTLGYFTLSNTNYSYFGIWYTNDEQARKVWVANPNTPLLDNSGVLTIDGTGTLKITSGGNTILNISDQVGTGNVNATLDDSGNFVLMDETQRRLWESFDHPTNTLLPGMKLGQNLIAGQNWSLTSWLSDLVQNFIFSTPRNGQDRQLLT